MSTISSIKSALVALIVSIPLLLGAGYGVDPRQEVFYNNVVPSIMEDYSRDTLENGQKIERSVNKITLFYMQDLQLEEKKELVSITSFSTRIEYTVKVTDTNNGFTETSIRSQDIIVFYKGAKFVDELIFPSYKVKTVSQGRELKAKVPIDSLESTVSHVSAQGNTHAYQNIIV